MIKMEAAKSYLANAVPCSLPLKRYIVVGDLRGMGVFVRSAACRGGGPLIEAGR
jgi:hypothetical protein